MEPLLCRQEKGRLLCLSSCLCLLALEIDEIASFSKGVAPLFRITSVSHDGTSHGERTGDPAIASNLGLNRSMVLVLSIT